MELKETKSSGIKIEKRVEYQGLSVVYGASRWKLRIQTGACNCWRLVPIKLAYCHF